MACNQVEILPISGPNDNRYFFHTYPESGNIHLDSQGKPFLKDYPLCKQVSDSIVPIDLWNGRQNRNKLYTKTAQLTGGPTVINKQPNTPRSHSLIHNTAAPNNNSTEQDQSCEND